MARRDVQPVRMPFERLMEQVAALSDEDAVLQRRGPRKRPDVRDSLILGLKDDDGLSFAEIADRVHMSATGVRMRYYALTGRERPDRPKTAARD